MRRSVWIESTRHLECKGDRELGPWKSKTVPDDTLSLREIMERYARDSAWLEDQRRRANEGYLDSDHDSVDFEKVLKSDLVDQQEFGESVKERIVAYERSLQQSDPKEPPVKKVAKKVSKIVKNAVKKKAVDEENE